ncbi:glycosyltransferase family 4 protein [Chloroflexales bacterium ZM16-3]|nr:glycosyltransferase family 4 protein [Chloroflexales bacterium ZM16-3]
MHILYLHQYFITRAGAGGTRSYEFARHFVRAGHRVTVLTAADPSIPWKARDRTRRRSVEGIEVVELYAGSSDYQSATTVRYGRRILNFARFALASNLAVLGLPRPDVVFATSTPLTIGIPGMLASRWHRAPLVFEVRDLWPEAPIQMGALRHPAAVLAARWLERAIYRRSARVVALSPGMRVGVVDAGYPAERVAVIPNAADLDLFSPTIDGSAIRARLGLERAFICAYFGTMGEANDLSQVLRAARIVQDRGADDIAFVLAGKGRRRPQFEALASELGLRNVYFLDPFGNKGEVAALVAAADLGLTIFKNVPVLYTCSPNKFFDTLAAGRPALVNTPGWLQSLVEQHECGVFARPDDPEHMADQILHLRDHPELCLSYGQNARRLAEQQFDRQQLAAQLLDVFAQALPGA